MRNYQRFVDDCYGEKLLPIFESAHMYFDCRENFKNLLKAKNLEEDDFSKEEKRKIMLVCIRLKKDVIAR